MFKTKNRIVLILVLIVLIGLIILLRFLSRRNEGNKIVMVDVPDDKNNGVLIRPNWLSQGFYVLKYEWNLNGMDVPAKINVMGIDESVLSESMWNKWISYFMMSKNPIKNDENIIAFSNSKDVSTFYINKKNKRAYYSRDLLFKPIEVGPNKYNEKELGEKLIETVNKNMEMSGGLNYEFLRAGKIAGIDNNEITSLEYKYILDNSLPIYTNMDIPLTARFYSDGTLINLSFALPFKVNEKIMSLPTKKFEEIKQLSGDKLKVLSVVWEDGSNIYSEDQMVIDKVIINNGNIGYIYETMNPYLQPAYIFEGEGFIGDKKIFLTVAALALKDNVYK